MMNDNSSKFNKITQILSYFLLICLLVAAILSPLLSFSEHLPRSTTECILQSSFSTSITPRTIEKIAKLAKKSFVMVFNPPGAGNSSVHYDFVDIIASNIENNVSFTIYTSNLNFFVPDNAKVLVFPNSSYPLQSNFYIIDNNHSAFFDADLDCGLPWICRLESCPSLGTDLNSIIDMAMSLNSSYHIMKKSWTNGYGFLTTHNSRLNVLLDPRYHFPVGRTSHLTALHSIMQPSPTFKVIITSEIFPETHNLNDSIYSSVLNLMVNPARNKTFVPVDVEKTSAVDLNLVLVVKKSNYDKNPIPFKSLINNTRNATSAIYVCDTDLHGSIIGTSLGFLVSSQSFADFRESDISFSGALLKLPDRTFFKGNLNDAINSIRKNPKCELKMYSNKTTGLF